MTWLTTPCLRPGKVSHPATYIYVGTSKTRGASARPDSLRPPPGLVDVPLQAVDPVERGVLLSASAPGSTLFSVRCLRWETPPLPPGGVNVCPLAGTRSPDRFHCMRVAQLVEQRPPKPPVAGSSPAPRAVPRVRGSPWLRATRGLTQLATVPAIRDGQGPV